MASDFSDSSCYKNNNQCATVTNVVESITEQISVTPTVITPGAVVVKLPVVLAEVVILELIHALKPGMPGVFIR